MRHSLNHKELAQILTSSFESQSWYKALMFTIGADSVSVSTELAPPTPNSQLQLNYKRANPKACKASKNKTHQDMIIGQFTVDSHGIEVHKS